MHAAQFREGGCTSIDTIDVTVRVSSITTTATALRDGGKHVHFGDEEGHLLTDGIRVKDVSRAARRLQCPLVGWREGAPAWIPEAFGGRPHQA
jgi:hypothetical protein